MADFTYRTISDRLWAKNWQPHSYHTCWGINLHFNYAYQWQGYGGSLHPCDYRFFGEGPLSSFELDAIHSWITKLQNRNTIAAYIDFQSYGQDWRYPWGYVWFEEDAPQPDKGVQDDLAIRALTALQVPYGTVYDLEGGSWDGNSESGVSEDYAYGTLGVKYPYRIEVRDQGEYGYLLPETLIDDTAIETFEALKVIGTDPLA
ncbi:carboxypeptidase B-like [Amphiura filiformis]|uniref:carboxypeptidase B-like n=1 Tax=Amphiura filiformis TaxID=82378 RepID=UPI003B211A95